MTHNAAGKQSRSPCASATLYLGGLLLAVLLPSAVLAQDNKQAECEANETAASEACNSSSSAANSAATSTKGSIDDTAKDNTAEISLASWDWAPIDAVPETLRDRQCVNCSGRYIDPLANASKDIDPQDSDIEARANSTELRRDELILTGGVSADQGYRQMRGDTVVVDRQAKTTVLEGNVSLREPGVLLRGEKAEIDTETDEARLHNGQFVFHREHMRGTASLLERNEQGMVKIDDGAFSFCAPDEKDWMVVSDRLDLDIEDGIATAHDARIEVEGVPVIYTPWLRFPLDDRRTTGFLWPDFGNDSTGGLDITVPFYFNLAPDYDALYSPRFIEERGLNHELQLRYLDPLKGQWLVGGAYMNSDDRYEDQAPPQRSTDRWLGVVRHSGLINQRWRSRINYSKASDVDYMKDLETSNLDSQRRTSLLQMASMDYLGDNWLLSAEAQQFQSLADDINDDYKKLPQITAAYRSQRTPFEIQPLFLAEYSNFDTDEERVIGQRLYAEAGATYPMQWTYGFLDSTVKYRQLAYDLDDLRVLPDDDPSAGSALGSIDGGLVFERFTDMAGRNMLQTLEPRLYYQYSEYEDQSDQPDFDSAELTFSYNQLFRSTRFSGKDRLDDSNQLAFGLTTRFIDSEDGTDLFSGSIGQIFYFRDRKVRLRGADDALDDNSSEIAGELVFNPSEQFGVRSSMIYDPHSGNMNSGHVRASYHTEQGGIFNIGYSYLRDQASTLNQQTTEEASFSSYLPLGNNWSAFAAINYSMVSNESVEDMIGVEYDSCCWTVRLLHLRYYNNVSGQTVDFDDPDLERENTIQFQIILKGMGGFGDRITDIMEDMIRGFEERDY